MKLMKSPDRPDQFGYVDDKGQFRVCGQLFLTGPLVKARGDRTARAIVAPIDRRIREAIFNLDITGGSP